jgi:hypothetical protein
MSDREESDKAERASAEALRRALEGSEDGSSPKTAAGDPEGLAELAESLRAAYDPKALSTRDHEEILSRAVPAAKNGGRSNVIRVSFGVVSAMAIAAAMVFYLRPANVDPVGAKNAPPIAWARSRSTTPLFSEPWKRGEATARIDRIALAREHDFRENRFAARRVR